ncbi:hypothetical protein JKA74_07550 [Marivirga sp. S37H4]|uniref:Lipocalin-like domain-containing protein n=1 Tax=Marivirga aurantiaca TaxID=2802615 RepID=A0A934WXT7_9BACT|nr:lipocalin family protein [Marivirga aurantiaca]MBK6264887.1 hypothetical protein [Marivirga aurantiaca]
MKKFRLITILMIGTVLFQSCKDDETTNQTDIVGVWTYNDLELEILVNNQDLATYYSSIGIPSAQADIYYEIFEALYKPDLEGYKIEFKADNTYQTTTPAGDSDESGTYEVNADLTELTTIDQDQVEYIYEIKSISNSSLTIVSSDSQETDINFDGTDETFMANVTLFLTK